MLHMNFEANYYALKRLEFISKLIWHMIYVQSQLRGSGRHVSLCYQMTCMLGFKKMYDLQVLTGSQMQNRNFFNDAYFH